MELKSNREFIEAFPPITLLSEPSPFYKDALESAAKNGWDKQRTQAIFEMRCEQVKKLGFKAYKNLNSVIKDFTGKSVTDYETQEERTTQDWLYFHLDDKLEIGEDCDWGGKTRSYIRKAKKGEWWQPPFDKQVIWRFDTVRSFNKAKKKIPQYLSTFILRLKREKVFNTFMLLESDDNLIILGCLWEFPPGVNSAGEQIHFFIDVI